MDMLPPLLIFLAAGWGSVAGTTVWHLIAGATDWGMFGILVSGSVFFTLFGAALIFAFRLVLVHRKSSRTVMAISLVLTGTLLGALMLSGVGSGGICVGGACYDGYLIGALYGMLTTLPFLFLRPAGSSSPAANR